MPANYPTLPTAAGTRLLVSTTLPDTHDAAGFAALNAAATNVGFLMETGGFPRAVREYGQVDLLSGKRFHFPTVEDVETMTPTFVYQDGDAGQAILEANADGETLLSFIYVLPSGLNVCIVGYATGYAPIVSSSTELVSGSITIRPVAPDAGSYVIRHTAA